MKKIINYLLIATGLIALATSAWAAQDERDYILTGNKLAIEKKYDQAIEQYEKALKKNPKNNQLNLIIGLAYANTGALDEALKYTRTAADVEPTYTAFFNLGLIYAARKETERSIETFNRALTFNPKSSAAEYQKGLVYTAADAYEEAETAFKRALELNPRLDEARIGLIGAYLKLDNRSGAMEQLDKFRQLKKDDFANILEARIKEGKSVS